MQVILKYNLVAITCFTITTACSSGDTHVSTSPADSNTIVEARPTVKAAAADYDPAEDTAAIKPDIKPMPKPEDLPIKRVGELVLNDSIDIANNEVISFMLLDSLLSEKRKSRDFYFKVFNKLMDRSGTVIGDAVGDYALTYVETYPKEFLLNSRSFSPVRLESWASNIGIELFLSQGDTKDVYNRSTQKIQANCKDCDTSDIARLNSFNKMVWTTIEQNLKGRKPE